MKHIFHSIQNFRFTFHLIMLGVVACFGFYMYCVSSAVHSAVDRKESLKNISLLQTEVSDLEVKYMAASNSITLESGSSFGLQEPAHKLFIQDGHSGETLSLKR